MANEQARRDDNGNIATLMRSSTVATDTVSPRANPSTGAQLVEITTPATQPAAIRNGNAVVGTTASQMTATSTTVRKVYLKAPSTNTGIVYVGAAGVTTTTGYELQAGQSVELEISNLNLIYVIASAAAQAIRWLGA